MATRLTRLFPLWALLISAAAMLAPEPLRELRPAIVPLLGLVMFGMGMTLSPTDFRAALRRPVPVGLGVGLQFLLMPLAAWLAARVTGLPEPLLVGLVLVGSCPGGTASNVIVYLARGDVALSISLTTITTLLAIVATPLLTWIYLGQRVDVDAGAMLLSVLRIVILPVALGVAANRLLGPRLGALKSLFPLLSVIAIVLIIGIIVALNSERLHLVALPLLLAVAIHNAVGLSGGYAVARLAGQDLRTSRTLAIEVGMQNSGLGVALALQHFSTAAALPGALFSVWHNLTGSALASIWSRRAK